MLMCDLMDVDIVRLIPGTSAVSCGGSLSVGIVKISPLYTHNFGYPDCHRMGQATSMHQTGMKQMQFTSKF
jgi:hypothetical protein